MKKLFYASILLALVIMIPYSSSAQVGISVSIGLPPPIFFPEPPAVVVLPDTYYVYAVPGIEIDLFFWNGWWWRPWYGRWYRSRYYDRGWVYYPNVPRFYYDVDPGWRVHYRERNWYGHPWYYERIDYQRLNRNWQRWHNNRHWEREQTWGVQNYRPRPQYQREQVRQERQREYQQRPEVQQYQRERQQQKQQQQRRPQPQAQEQRQPPRERPEPQRQEKKPQVQQPRQEPRQRGPEPQRQEQRPQFQERRQEPKERSQEQQRQQQPQEKPEGGRGERQDRRNDDRK
jgi:hypothetical protein